MTDEATIEERAKEMGWSSQEEFRGDKAKWVDAEEYVRRGEAFLPILQARERKQSQELQTLRSEQAQLKQIILANTETIEALKEFNTEATRKAVREERAATLAAIKQAKKDGDVDAEIELGDKLAEQNEALREAEKTKEAAPKQQQQINYNETPEWKQWAKENPWFGTDQERTDMSVAVGMRLRRDPQIMNLPQKQFLDKVSEEVDRVMGNARREAPSKVGETNGSRESSGKGKSFADLPADAKAICERQATRLVGKGRAFETLADWRKHYMTEYFSE
jgi:hypothetical protein